MKKSDERRKEFIKIRRLIKKNYEYADSGLFNTRNIVGDNMSTIFTGKYFTLDICYHWMYFEVFGTKEKEFKKLKKFYNRIGISDKKLKELRYELNKVLTPITYQKEG